MEYGKDGEMKEKNEAEGGKYSRCIGGGRKREIVVTGERREKSRKKRGE